MKTIATVMQITRSLLILTPAEYDKVEGGFSSKAKRSSVPTNFNVPQIFELNDSLKDHPYEKTEELAAFVKRCASSVSMELGDLFVCIEDEDVLITKEYKHAPAKEKLLPTFARVEAENVLHQEVTKYTILNFEYGQQYGKASKNEDVSASLFAMNTGLLTDLQVNFEKEGLHIVKVTPPIAGMLFTSKVDLNSATRAIALISMDFAATRLVVLHNGAPVFQQSFSSVLEDIAEMFSLEFGISKMGAIDLIRQEGLGACNKCNSATTKKQTMTMLDNAAGEILRNLRMVISTMRLDIDQIVLCDALAKLPNIAQYCRSVGLTAPMENVTNLFTGATVAPTAAPSATEKGFDATSFITMNGVLTMPIGEANLLLGETNAFAALTAAKGSKFGKGVTAGVAIIALIWMAGVGGWWFALEMQQKNDTDQLGSTTFTSAKELIQKEELFQTRLANLETDAETLPHTVVKSADTVKEYYTQILNAADAYESANLNIESNELSATLHVQDYYAFVDLKNTIESGGYFDVQDNYSANKISRQGLRYEEAKMIFSIKQSVQDKAQEKLDKENGISSSSSTESSSTESSQASS